MSASTASTASTDLLTNTRAAHSGGIDDIYAWFQWSDLGTQKEYLQSASPQEIAGLRRALNTADDASLSPSDLAFSVADFTGEHSAARSYITGVLDKHWVQRKIHGHTHIPRITVDLGEIGGKMETFALASKLPREYDDNLSGVTVSEIEITGDKDGRYAYWHVGRVLEALTNMGLSLDGTVVRGPDALNYDDGLRGTSAYMSTGPSDALTSEGFINLSIAGGSRAASIRPPFARAGNLTTGSDRPFVLSTIDDVKPSGDLSDDNSRLAKVLRVTYAPGSVSGSVMVIPDRYLAMTRDGAGSEIPLDYIRGKIGGSFAQSNGDEGSRFYLTNESEGGEPLKRYRLHPNVQTREELLSHLQRLREQKSKASSGVETVTTGQ